MKHLLILLLSLGAACRDADDRAVQRAQARWWSCRTQHLNEACQQARTRAALAMYSLRAEAPVELQAAGVAQALELSQWLSLCGYEGSAKLLAATQAYPADISAIRRQLTLFVIDEVVRRN